MVICHNMNRTEVKYCWEIILKVKWLGGKFIFNYKYFDTLYDDGSVVSFLCGILN